MPVAIATWLKVPKMPLVKLGDIEMIQEGMSPVVMAQ